MGSKWASDRRRLGALLLACAGYFFVLLDVTIVNVALANVASDLHASRLQLQWVVDAYALVLAGMMLGAGDIADRLGARRVFLVGLALFGAGSAGCAAAPVSGALIGARAVQGLGAAAVLPTSLAIVNQLYTEPGIRERAIGIWVAVGSVGLIAGPLLGGVLVSGPGWRWVFWLNVPLAVLAALLGGALLPRSSQRRSHRPDVAGQVLGTLSLLALVFTIIEGTHDGWGATPVIAGAAALAVLLPAAAAVELRRRRPMLDLRWFRNPEFSAANGGAAAMNMGTLGALFAISLFLQQDQGQSPFELGLHVLPLAAPLALIAPYAGSVVSRLGPRAPASLGLAGCGVGYLVVAVLGAQMTDALGTLALAVSGIGLGFATPGLVTGATRALGRRRAGIASAVNNTARQVGGAVGVALIGGLESFSTALTLSGLVLIAGGTVVLAFMREVPQAAA
jgi:DHA2 family methylenomycin A resistance protein-like MFS transporter